MPPLNNAKLDKLLREADRILKYRQERKKHSIGVSFVQIADECAIPTKDVGHHFIIRTIPSGKFIPDGKQEPCERIEDAVYLPALKLIDAPERPVLVYREDPATETSAPAASQPHVEGEWQSDKQRETQELIQAIEAWQLTQPTYPQQDLADSLPEKVKKLIGENVGTTMAAPSPVFSGAAKFGRAKPNA